MSRTWKPKSPPGFDGIRDFAGRVRRRGKLPHLTKDGGTYFITFRLRDAVVATPTDDRESIDVDDAEAVARCSEPPLTLGSCALGDQEIAELVETSLLHFDDERYELYAWCAMPNHVHVVMRPLGEHSVTTILHSWKSFTALEANRILGLSGSFWEQESFDHLIRTAEAYERFVWYTENNPVEAGLCRTAKNWRWSSAARRLDPTR